jgi:hypothetical protein
MPLHLECQGKSDHANIQNLTMATSIWQRRDLLRLVGVIVALGSASCGSATPTSPRATGMSGSDVLAVEVSCPTSLLIGQKGPCTAIARLRSGQTPVVSFEAMWSSTRPEIVAVDTLGVVNGRSAGQATVTVLYRDRQAAATLVVTAEDAIRPDSGQAHQGDFSPGSTVTMWLQGYYSVASAESGLLSLRISDQTRTISTTTPIVVTRGGDFFLLSSTFAIPEDSVEVCRTAILRVGSVTIAEPQSKSFPLWCIPIRR